MSNPSAAPEPGNTRGSITPCQNTSARPAGAADTSEAIESSGASEPRCIASPRLDGHTRLRWVFESCRPGELADLLTELRTPRTREQAKRERRAGPMVRRLPTGEWCEVTVSGVRRQMVTLHVHDVMHATINADEGELRLQFKAHGLWAADDQRAHMLGWIHAWTSMLRGPVDVSPFALGWSVTGIELCADFVGVRWVSDDASAFLGRYKRERIRCYTDDADRVETINVGSRASNVSWCLYDKTRQIESAKDGANLPTYRSTWESFGWQGEEVSRVELRLTARGLTFDELELRDPEALTPANLARAWSHACDKYRLVDPSTATRRERADTDPRWTMVADSCGVEPKRMRQARRVAEDAHEERTRRAAKQASKALLRLGALHGLSVTDDRGVATLAVFADALASRECDLPAYAAGYRALIEPALGDAVREAGERFVVTMDGETTGLSGD